MITRMTAACALLVVMLGGCATRSPEDRRALASLDPRTLDPATLRLAAVMPEGLEPQPEGMVVIVASEIPGNPASAAERRFVLRRSMAAEDQPPPPEGGFRAFAFKFTESDATRFRAWREGVESAIATGAGMRLRLRARANYCRIGAQPGNVAVTVLARANAGASYGAISAAGTAAVNATASGREEVPPCGGGAPRTR